MAIEYESHYFIFITRLKKSGDWKDALDSGDCFCRIIGFLLSGAVVFQS